MLLVILGAGASFDSAPSLPANAEAYSQLQDRPPLASELFGNRQYFGEILKKYPDCLAVVPRLRDIRQGHSIETLLGELQVESNKSLVRKRQIASIRYYLQEILTACPDNWIGQCQEVLNHLTLLDDIVNYSAAGERVCFVTFNYDKLIDWAFDKTGFRIESFQDYISKNFMLIKLHGSVNWGRVVATPLPAQLLLDPLATAHELIRKADEAIISKEYVLAGGVPPRPKDDRAIFPALAIPIESKLDFECPVEHVAALKEAIPAVTKILISDGVLLNSHFWSY